MRTAYSNVPRRSLYYVLVCTSATLLHVAAENTARDVWFSEPLADSLQTTDRIGIVVRYKQPETDDDALSADQMLVGQAGRKAGRRASPVDLAGVAGGDMIRARAMSCWRRRVCSSSSSSSGGGGGAYHSTTACISIARRDELTTHQRQFQPSLNSSVCKNEIKFY